MNQRTINWKLLAVSLVTAIVAVVALRYFHSWQLGRLANGLLRIADAREADKKWRDAAAYCDRYLRVHPDDAAVRGRLATDFAKGVNRSSRPEMTRAVELHYRALAAEPGRDQEMELRPALAKLLLETGRVLEAEREALDVLKLKSDDPSASRTSALALVAQWENGTLATAKLEELRLLSTIENARRVNPSDTLLAEITAKFYRDHPQVVAAEPEFAKLSIEERKVRADECLNSLVEHGGDDPKAYLARYRYRTQHALSGAEEDLAKAMEIGSGDEEVVLTAARLAFQKGLSLKSAGAAEAETNAELKKAKSLYEGLLSEKDENRSPDAHGGLGDSLLALGDFDGAIVAWRKGLKQFAPTTIQIAFLARIADSYLNADRAAEADDSLKAIDQLVSTLGSSVPREQRLGLIQSQGLRRASWHMKRNELRQAISILQEVIAREGSGTSGSSTLAIAWGTLGRANAQIGDWQEASVAFDRALPLDPNSASLRLAAGYAWLQVGRPDLAVDRLEQSLTLQPSAEAMLLLASAESEHQRMHGAKHRNWERMERILSELEREPAAIAKVSSPWRLDFLRADLALSRAAAEGDEGRGRKEGLAVLKKAEPKHAAAEEFWRLAISAYQRLGDREAADRALAKFEALSKSPADQAIAKSKLASLRGDLGLAKQILEQLLEVASRQANQNEQSKLRLALTDVAIASGDKALAERLLTDEAQQRRGDVNVLRSCCEAAILRGDSQAVAKWADELNKCGEVGKWWARYFRTIQSVAGITAASDPKLLETLDEADKLISIRPHWPMPHSLRGTILERRGQLKEAATALEHAIQLGERRPAIFEQLVALLDRLNRNADVERYLSRLESFMPFSQRLTEIATNYEMRREHPEQAVALARAAVAKRPNDVNSHLWLGRLMLITKQFSDAEAEFKKTLELAPTDVRGWNGLFTYYLRTGQLDHARQTLNQLGEQVDLKPTDRSFVLAQCYELLGDWKNAEAQYETTTTTAPNRADAHIRLAVVYLRSSPEKAEQSLRKALEVDPQSATARRMLASLLATRGNSDQFEEAEKLLGAIDPTRANVAVEDRRLNALLLAQYGDARQVVRAVELLEGMVTKGDESTPGDRLVLARIYESQARSSPDPQIAADKRRVAREQLVAVANLRDAEAGHLAALIDFLLRNNELADAEQWLDKLEAMLNATPNDNPSSIAQLIELRLRHGSGDRCERWLERLAAVDTDPVRPTAMRAVWLANQKRETEIESLVEPIALQTVAAGIDDLERGLRARRFGDLYLKIGQNQVAQRWYQTAVGYDRAQFPAQVRALAMSGQISEALRLCQERSEGDSASQAATVLALVLAEVNVQEAVDSNIDPFLSTKLKQHPHDSRLLYAIATLRAVQGRYKESIEHYRSLVKLEPRNVSALNNLAMMLAEVPERRAESLQLINKAIDIAGSQPGLLDTKGTILVYQGDSQNALFLLEAAAREAGTDARHRFHLAAAYHRVGEATKAKQQLLSAIAMNLEKQVLTPTDRRILSDLKADLFP